MKMHPRFVLLVAMTLFGCSNPPPTEPTPGTVDVVLQSPFSDDGIVFVTIVDADIAAVQSSEGFTEWHRRDGSIHVVTAGDLDARDFLFRIEVADIGASFSGVVREVASRTDYQQRNPTDYTLVFRPRD